MPHFVDWLTSSTELIFSGVYNILYITGNRPAFFGATNFRFLDQLEIVVSDEDVSSTVRIMCGGIQCANNIWAGR